MAGEFHYELLQNSSSEKFIKCNSLVYPDGVIRLTPSNCCLPYEYRKHVDRIRDFKVLPDDVWIITYPKCGTTWTQELVWLLLNDLDFDTAKKIPQQKRSPFLEFSCLINTTKNPAHDASDTVKDAENLKSPRCIKTHLPLQLLPKELWIVKPKIVYVAREPKDATVSYYHHHRLFFGYSGSCDDFAEAFMEGIVLHGSLCDHIKDFWELRHESYILFNTFEEMKKDLPGIINRTARYLNRSVTLEQQKKLCEHLSFESMKNNPMVSHEDEVRKIRGNSKDDGARFMRKGQVGSWNSDLSPQMAEKINQWAREKLNAIDYPFLA